MALPGGGNNTSPIPPQRQPSMERSTRHTPSPLERPPSSGRRSPIIHFPGPPKDTPPIIRSRDNSRQDSSPERSPSSSPRSSPSLGRKQTSSIRDSPLLTGHVRRTVAARDSPDGGGDGSVPTMSLDRALQNGGGATAMALATRASVSSSSDAATMSQSREPRTLSGRRAAAASPGTTTASSNTDSDSAMADISASNLANLLSNFTAMTATTTTTTSALPSSGAPTPDNAFESPEPVAPPSPPQVASSLSSESRRGHTPAPVDVPRASSSSEADRVLVRAQPNGRCDSPRHTNIQHVFPTTAGKAAAAAAAAATVEETDGGKEAAAATVVVRPAHDKHLWEKVIVPHWALLLETINVEDICADLLTEKLLDDEQVLSLRSCSDGASAAARMVTYIGAHGDSAIITFSRIVSEVSHRQPPYKHLVSKLRDALRRQLSTYYSDDGSSSQSSAAPNSSSVTSSPSPPAPMASPSKVALHPQISSTSTASNLLAVPNIRLHLYDANIDDDSVYDSSDFRTSCDISPLSSRRASLLDVVTYSPRATMERNKKPSTPSRYTEVVISPGGASMMKKQSSGNSPLLVGQTTRASGSAPNTAAAAAAAATGELTPGRLKKHRKTRSRGGLDNISSSSSSPDEDSPRTAEHRRASAKKNPGDVHPALRPTLSGQIAELSRLQDSLMSTVQQMKKNDELHSHSTIDDEDEDEEGDDPAPAAICIARDSLFQPKYSTLTRSPGKESSDEQFSHRDFDLPTTDQSGHVVDNIYDYTADATEHGYRDDYDHGGGGAPSEPVTPPHSMIRHSFLGPTAPADSEPVGSKLRHSTSYMQTPSFYDTTTTLSPTPGRMSSPYPGSPESVELDSPMSAIADDHNQLSVGIVTTHLELWMVTWIQEFLEVDQEYVDIFEMRLPSNDNLALSDESSGKAILLHLLIEDMTLAQFKTQREDTLISISEMLNVPIRLLRAMVRQVNEHAILLSLWLPLFCCTVATEMAVEKNRRLLSFGIAMVISGGRRIWCGQDRGTKAGILSKLKQRLHSNDEKRFYETMEINVDRVAMELWHLVRPISKPVWHAALAGNVDMLRMLVSVNCDIEQADQAGNTPVHICSQVGNVDALEYLLEHGASANSRNKMHMTALHWAANQGNPAVVRALLQNGAKINAVELRHHATPLHVASMMGHVEVVEMLVANGADLAAVDKHQNTSLHLAIMFAPVDPLEDNAKSELYADVVELLLGSKAQASPCGVAWITPLHLASASGQEYLVEILLKYRANVNALDQELWQTPLHYAVMAEHASVAELLVIAGANVTVTDKNGQSPLDLAETVTLSTVLETAERDSLLEVGGVVSPAEPTLCIVGDSGSGKSSLIHCLCSAVQKRKTFNGQSSSDSDESVTFETSTQRFNSFRVKLVEDIGVILRDVPASVQHHLPYCCYLGNKTSLFVVMLNAMEPFEEQIRCANTWLELIAFSCMAVAVRPSVMLVTTHVDVEESTRFVLPARTINTLADQYDGVLNVSRRMHLLNCRTPYSSPMAQFLEDVIVETSELMRTCRIPKLCNDVAQLLPELQCQYAVPIVEFELFERLVRQQLPAVSIDTTMMKHVISYLHDLGQLVCVRTKEDGPAMIVLEPDWLCWDGFGRLMRPTSPEQDTVNPAITAAAGKVSQVGLQKLFSMVPCDSDVLVHLLTFCAMCLPIQDYYQLTATMLGIESQRSMSPSGGRAARQLAWSKDAQFSRYAGRRWSMEGGQPFPLSVVSWLQVACAEHVSDEVLATMVTWRIGFKLAVESSVAEALVELTPDRQYMQLLVRCVKDARQQCAVLLQHMTNMIVDTLGAELRGIETEISAISPRQLRSFSLPLGVHFDAVPFNTALSVYRAFLCVQSSTAHSIAEQNAQPQRGRQMVASFINIGGKLEKLSDVLLLDEGDIRLIAQSVFGRELCERLLTHQYEELSRDATGSPDDLTMPAAAMKPLSSLDVEGIPETLQQAASELRVPAMPSLWRWMAQPWLGMLRRWQGRRRSSWVRLQQALSILTDGVAA